MALWENEYHYNIIEDIDSEKFDMYMDEELEEATFIDEWFAFAQYYAIKEGIRNKIYVSSFASMITTYMTGKLTSTGTEEFIQEDQIDTEIMVKYTHLKRRDIEDVERAKKLFDFIFKIYLNYISKYEKKNKRIEVRVTETQYRQFMRVKGKNKAEKFRNLLRYVE